MTAIKFYYVSKTFIYARLLRPSTTATATTGYRDTNVSLSGGASPDNRSKIAPDVATGSRDMANLIVNYLFFLLEIDP